MSTEPVESTTPEAPEVDQTEAPEPTEKRGNEAAKYRVRAREAEARVAELEARVESFQRRTVEAAASELAVPGDLFTLAEKTVADFIGEDGEVSVEAVAEAVNALLEARPGLGKAPAPERRANPAQGSAPFEVASGPTWADMFKRS